MDDPITKTRSGDVLRRNGAHLVGAWLSPSDVGPTAGGDGDVFFDLAGPLAEEGLDHAVQAQKRDNVLLGEAMVRIGLLGRQDLAAVQNAQAGSNDTVDALLVAGAIRSRLGEILLNARHISPSQLEAALEMQRDQGGLLGEILLGQGWLNEDTLDAALALQAARAVA